MTELQEAALQYLTAGLRLLALNGKRPNGRVHGDQWSWEESFNGEPETETEIAAVLEAFTAEKGTTGIAILIPQDFLVADVDTDEAANLLMELGWVRQQDDVVSITKNGLHIWFTAPGQHANRWAGQRSLLFKGFGGYVVAPPSLHFDAAGVEDGTYEWGTDFIAPSGIRILPNMLPEGVRELFKMEDQYAETKPEKQVMTHHVATSVQGKSWWEWPVTSYYATEGLERAIENAAVGNQNNVIHWAAMTAKEEGVPFDVAYERLMAASIKGGHPKNRARDTIRGAYKRAPRA